MGIVIVETSKLDDHASIGIFNGFLTKQTTIAIKKDFVFDKFNLLHTLGHVLGIGHEVEDSKYPYQPMFNYAHGYVLPRGNEVYYA